MLKDSNRYYYNSLTKRYKKKSVVSVKYEMTKEIADLQVQLFVLNERLKEVDKEILEKNSERKIIFREVSDQESSLYNAIIKANKEFKRLSKIKDFAKGTNSTKR